MYVFARKTLGQNYVLVSVSVTCVLLTVPDTGVRQSLSLRSFFTLPSGLSRSMSNPWKPHALSHCAIIPVAVALQFFPLGTVCWIDSPSFLRRLYDPHRSQLPGILAARCRGLLSAPSAITRESNHGVCEGTTSLRQSSGRTTNCIDQRSISNTVPSTCR